MKSTMKQWALASIVALFLCGGMQAAEETARGPEKHHAIDALAERFPEDVDAVVFKRVRLEDQSFDLVASSDTHAIVFAVYPEEDDCVAIPEDGEAADSSRQAEGGIPVARLDAMARQREILEKMEEDATVTLAIVANSATLRSMREGWKDRLAELEVDLVEYADFEDYNRARFDSFSASVPEKSPEEEFAMAYEAYKKKQYSVSFPAFASLAERGYAPAFGYLGLAYELGEGVSKQRETAVSWYEKAIGEKEHLGVYRLGMMYRMMGRDDLAFQVYQTAAEGGWATGEDHLHLGEMLEKGMGTKRDFAQATEHYRIAMNTAASPFDKREAREGLARLGELYGVEDFDVELPPKLQQASADTLFALGEENLDEFSLSPDKPLAFACFKAAAEEGHALAACRLSAMYSDGRLPIRDTEKADEYGAIASAGMVELCRKRPELASEAGFAYQVGSGCMKDTEKAKACFQIGAENGDEDCLWRLGLIFQAENRLEEAFQHLLKAAELGQGMAMYEVAECYETGSGTPRDREKALSWYRRCARSPYAAAHEAAFRLEQLSRE